jgi:deoxyhypusine synthase
MTKVSDFIGHHYRHFNSATMVDAADAYVSHLEGGCKMLVAMAGAMSTAEIGLSLAEMIRQDKVHAICCTGANLEEDIFNLVANSAYRRIPNWRNLTPGMEKELERQGLNRVTDTCIPGEEAFHAIEGPILNLWQQADSAGVRRFPHEFLYQLIREGTLASHYQIDPQDSWMAAAAEKNLPLFVPGWEDCTLGNFFVAQVLQGKLSGFGVMRTGLEYMGALAEWYVETTLGRSLPDHLAKEKDLAGEEISARTNMGAQLQTMVGFFQIGGGIAGNFPICVVPMIHQDLRRPCPYWAYFCQISDSTTSFGSYSGAAPTEKITWGKLDLDTPMYVIESDATIVAPLIFARVLGW